MLVSALLKFKERIMRPVNGKTTKSFNKPKTLHINEDIQKPVVYIGNLSYKRNDYGILKLFKPFGYVVKVNLIQDEKLDRSKGIAFVEMQTIKAAKDAVKGLNGTLVDGRTIKVSIAEDRIHPEHAIMKRPQVATSKNEIKAKIKKEKSTNSKEGLHHLFNHLRNK